MYKRQLQKEHNEAAKAAVKQAQSEVEKARRAADAAAGAPWQDESWQNKGKSVADDNNIEWEG